MQTASDPHSRRTATDHVWDLMLGRMPGHMAGSTEMGSLNAHMQTRSLTQRSRPRKAAFAAGSVPRTPTTAVAKARGDTDLLLDGAGIGWGEVVPAAGAHRRSDFAQLDESI